MGLALFTTWAIAASVFVLFIRGATRDQEIA